MLGTVVMRWLADQVFEAALSSGSQYREEIRRYFRERGLPIAGESAKPTK
jgi:hypothetical protein